MKQSRIVTNVSCLSSSQELWQATSSRESTPKLPHHLESSDKHKFSLKATEADAIREASYIGSFPVDEESQEARAEFIKKHLLNMKITTPAKPVLLLISLSGIKVCCGSGETVFMSHAIKRISYATCQSEKKRFSFLAREPKSASNIQYCHTFATKKAGQAEELNNIVANAFKVAYLQQQQSTNNNMRTTTSFNDLIKAQLQQQQLENKMADLEKQQLLSNQLLCISTSNIDNLCQQRKERKESFGDNDENTLAWARCMVTELLKAELSQADDYPSDDVTNFNNNNNNNHNNINNNSNTPYRSSENPNNTNNNINDHSNSNPHSNSNHHHPPSSKPLHHLLTNLHTHPVSTIRDFIEDNFTDVFGGATSPSSTSHLFTDLSPVQPPPWSTPIRNQQSITSSVSMVSMGTDAKNRKRGEGHVENFTREYFNKNGRADEMNDCKLHEAAWYQPGVPRDVALNHLLNQANGSFIVRDSSTHPGCYALSIKVPKYDSANEITHYLIVKTQRNTFKIKGLTKEWTSLTSLVLHHTIIRELLPCLLILPS